MFPTIAELYTVVRNAQGEPWGLRRDHTRVRRLGRAASVEAVVEALEGAEREVEALLGVVLIAGHLEWSTGAAWDALEARLVGALDDTRRWEHAWGEASYQKTSLQVSVCAAEAWGRGLEQLRRRQRRDAWGALSSPNSPQPPPVDALVERLGAGLRRALGVVGNREAARQLVSGGRQAVYDEAGRAALMEGLERVFVEVARDRARIAEVRVQAIEAWARIAFHAHRSHSKGAAERDPDADEALSDGAREVMVRVLEEALTEPFRDVRFKTRARELLLKVAPMRLDALHASGALVADPLPEPEDLMASWGYVNAAQVRRVASAVSLHQVRAGLASDDPRRVLSAICLVSGVSGRMGAHEAARALVARLDDARQVTLEPQGEGDRRRSGAVLVLGDVASDRLLKLLGPRLRDLKDAAARALLLESLEVALEAQARVGQFKSVQRLVRESRWLADDARAEVEAHLLRVGLDRSRAPGVRYAALMSDTRESTRQVALERVLDPEEDGALRALLGARLHRWMPEAVEALVDASETPWVCRASEHEALPICEPARSVPLSWLVASLEVCDDVALHHTVVRALGARFAMRSQRDGASAAADDGGAAPSEDDGSDGGGLAQVVVLEALAAKPSAAAQEATPEEVAAHRGARMDALRASQQTLRAIVHVQALGALRGVLDAPTQERDRAPRWSAAVCLALLGDAEDAERLTVFASAHGVWSRTDPLTPAFEQGRMLDHLVLYPLHHARPHHLLEPYLRVGFGDHATERMMARVLVRMAAEARAEGRTISAKRGLALARARDPLNLDARRR